MSKKYKVVVTDFIADSLATEKQILGDHAEVIALNALYENDLTGKIEDADAIIQYHLVSIKEKTISALRNCKLIVRGGVGIDNVDHAFARSRGIPVANVPDYGSEDVADTAIGMLLTLTRGIHFLNSRLRSNLGVWSYTQVQPLQRLRGSSIGIVGLGRIGTAAALRAKALGMNVIFYDPYKPDGFDKALGIKRAEDFKMMLQNVTMVTFHCPLTPETHHMMNNQSIQYLSNGSFLVNTSRGGVVDTGCIADAIENGRLAGAGFDVLPEEPPLNDKLVNAWRNPEHPAHHRVIVNPHSAFYSEQGLREIRVKTAEACLRAILNEPIRNVVN
jgi:C-terminal binding protein